MWKRGLTLLSLITLTACGSDPATISTRSNSNVIQQANNQQQTRMMLKELDPVTLSYRLSSDKKRIERVGETTVPDFRFEEIKSAEMNGGDEVATVITGIGIDAIEDMARLLRLRQKLIKEKKLKDDDTEWSGNYKIEFAIEARQYNPTTKSFSAKSKIFGPSHMNLQNAQRFIIADTDTPNIVLTGLGMRLYDGEVKRLELQRKTMADLMEDGESLQSSSKVILPPGWAAIGFYIRFKSAVDKDARGFIRDIKLYSARWK